MADNETKPVNTKVKLGGVEVELKGMTTETGLQLYRALPADYQHQADQIAEVVTVFAAVSEIAEKHKLNPTQLAQEWLQTAGNSAPAKAARQNLSDVKKAAIAQLEAAGIDVNSLARMIPGGETFVSAAQTAAGAAKIVGGVASATGAAIDGGWHGAPRMWDLFITMGSEAKGQLFGYGSDAPKDAARAFGAATMALRYQSVQERHNKPMIDMPLNGKQSQLEANPVQVTLSGWDAVVQWIKINMPIVSAAFNWLTDWSSSKPTWAQFQAEANAEAITLKNGKEKTFQQLVDDRMVPADSLHAGEVLKAAETVAGLKTQKGLADATAAAAGAEDTFAFRDSKGHDVTRKNGQEVARITPLDRVAEAGKAIIGEGETHEQLIRGAATAAGAATVLNNSTKGLVRGLTAHVDTPRPATEWLMSWAKKPVQFGAGEFVVHGWKGKLLNLPGTIAVGAGDLAGRAFRWTVNGVTGSVAAIKNLATGTAEGVHTMVNGADIGKAGSKMEAVGTLAGKAGVAMIAAAPIATAAQTLESIGKGEDATALLHAGETAGLTIMVLKGGLKRVPYVGPVISTTEGIIAAKDGNTGGVVKAGTELGTVASFAAAGAGIGVWFGGVGAVPGALVGAGIGGIASIFTGSAAENYYNRNNPQPAPAAQTTTPTQSEASMPAPLTNEQLSAAHEGVIQQARMAMAPGRMGTTREGLTSFNLVGMANSNVKLGGLIPSMPTGGNTTPTDTRVASASRAVTA